MEKPVKQFRAGAVSVSVWNNTAKKEDGQSAEYKTVSFQRSYKDKNGEWKNTSSLRINDLPRATIVLNKAYEYLVMQNAVTNSVTEQPIKEEIVY